jgi:hypothetical protein
VAHVGDNFIAVDLRPVEYGVIPALNGDGFAAVEVVSVQSVPLPLSLPFAALTLANTLIPAPLPPAPMLTPTPPPLLLFLPPDCWVLAAPLRMTSFFASSSVSPPAFSWLPAMAMLPSPFSRSR